MGFIWVDRGFIGVSFVNATGLRGISAHTEKKISKKF